MNDRPRGLYEVLITEAIAAQLRDLGAELHAIRDGVRSAEAPDRLALHLGRIVQRALAGVNDANRVAVGVSLARKLIEHIEQTISGSQAGLDAPIEPGTVLRAVVGRTPDGRVETMPEPLIPLLDTTLLTNAPGEPRVGNQLLTELHSADRIDLVMAFIRRSGIAPLLDRFVAIARAAVNCACSRRRIRARRRAVPLMRSPILGRTSAFRMT